MVSLSHILANEHVFSMSAKNKKKKTLICACILHKKSEQHLLFKNIVFKSLLKIDNKQSL